MFGFGIVRLGISRSGGAIFLLFALLFGFAAFQARAEDDPLFYQLGGRDGIERIVQGLTTLYQTDPRVKEDFDNINPTWLAARLSDFICVTAGGPCSYKGRSMMASHQGLHLNTAKFNAVVEDLQTAMAQAGVSFSTQNRLLARLAPLQREIVSK